MPAANQKYTHGGSTNRKIERPLRTKSHNHYPIGMTGFQSKNDKIDEVI